MSSRKACELNAQDLEPAMFVATAYDRLSEAWTRVSPSSSVSNPLSDLTGMYFF